MKTQHTKTRVISIKIAVVVGNGSSRRLAPDAFGAVALDPSGGASLLECQRILLFEFGNFVDHSASKKSVFNLQLRL